LCDDDGKGAVVGGDGARNEFAEVSAPPWWFGTGGVRIIETGG